MDEAITVGDVVHTLLIVGGVAAALGVVVWVIFLFASEFDH